MNLIFHKRLNYEGELTKETLADTKPLERPVKCLYSSMQKEGKGRGVILSITEGQGQFPTLGAKRKMF